MGVNFAEEADVLWNGLLSITHSIILFRLQPGGGANSFIMRLLLFMTPDLSGNNVGLAEQVMNQNEESTSCPEKSFSAV